MQPLVLLLCCGLSKSKNTESHHVLCWHISLHDSLVCIEFCFVSFSLWNWHHIKAEAWNINTREMRTRWRTFLLPFPAFWLQGNDLFLSKFSFENLEYISLRMEFSTKRRKIYVEFPTVSFPAFCTFLFIGITLHPAFKSELLLGEDECFWDHR